MSRAYLGILFAMGAFLISDEQIPGVDARGAVGRGAGFALFSAEHVLALALGAVFILVMARVYILSEAKRRRGLRLGVVSAALFIELARTVLPALAGNGLISHLPLHLCALAVYFCFFHALRGGELLGQFLYAFCLPGALAALLFPDWRGCGLLHPASLASFALHFLLVAYILERVFARELVPDIKAAPRCLLLMLALAVPVYIFDRLTGMNYMFLLYPPPGSPLALFAALGTPGYLVGYIPLLITAWALIYAPWLRPRRAEQG